MKGRAMRREMIATVLSISACTLVACLAFALV
jgi:hypothetical protein